MNIMSINRKSMVVLGITVLVGIAVLWLVSLLFSFQLNQEQILFEFGQMSAWTGTTTGFFIDSRGNVYTFINDSPRVDTLIRYIGEKERGEPHYTTSDLLKYYGNSRRLVGTIDKGTLNEMVTLIEPSSTGLLANDDPLTPGFCSSRDAGIYIFRAYLYSSDRNTYTSVHLYTMGDVQEINLSQEGRTLHKWLETTCIENDYFSSCKSSQYVCRP